MKYTITALDIHFLVQEFQKLISSKVDKIYQSSKDEFLFMLHVPNSGKVILRINLPKYIFLTDYKGDVPDQPSHFCMFLRKYLANARVREVSQLGFERVICLLLEKKEGKYRMYIELFSNGNIILCDENDVIKSALVTKKWKDRTIRGNLKYEFPRREHDFLLMKKADFLRVLKESDKESIVKALAIDIGLGGRYAEEICQRAGIDKDSMSGFEKAYDAAMSLIRSNAAPAAVLKGDDVIDIVPIELEIYNDYEKKAYDSFSSVLDNELTKMIMASEHEKKKTILEKESRKLQKIVKEQELAIEKLEEEIDTNQKKGELLYEKYQLVQDILENLKKARKTHSWKEVKEKLKGHKIVKQINEKQKQILIDI